MTILGKARGNLTSGLPLATKWLNVQVLVNGTAAPIFAVDNVTIGTIGYNGQVPGPVIRLREGVPVARATAPHCTAMVTVFEVSPPMLRITGTASPAGAPTGTSTFTW